LNPTSIWFRLFFVTAVGGLWFVLLGLLVFGEAFGLPFHPAPGHLEELSWERFGIFVPMQAVIHKAFGIGDMIYLSILFAAFHLGFGYVFGFVNEMRHNKKYALAKLGWLACLFGLFTLLTFSLAIRSSPNRIALWVWDTPLGWFPRAIQSELSAFVGLKIPLASLILIFEAFLKFYKGNGTPFRPFGARGTQEV